MCTEFFSGAYRQHIDIESQMVNLDAFSAGFFSGVEWKCGCSIRSATYNASKQCWYFESVCNIDSVPTGTFGRGHRIDRLVLDFPAAVISPVPL